MSGARGVGGVELLRAVLPELALDALGLLTWLGSVPLLTSMLVLGYWFGARERGAFGLGTALGAFSLTVGLKALFELPRPASVPHLVAADGFGFPSGHAIAATVVWGFLAARLDVGTRRTRVLAAGAVVALVAISRVALGVHYAIDVVAGVAVGAVYLAAVTRLEGPSRAFGVGAGIALLATLATVGGGDALVLLGGTSAGAVAWHRLPVPAEPWGREAVFPAIAAAAAVGALVLAADAWGPPGIVAFAVGAVAIGSVIGLPALLDRV